MELLGSEELIVTKDALKYAKIISASIEDDFQRKRAFASIVALDTFADYLLTKDVEINISKNLFKIAPISSEFEIADIYHNGWKLDVRVVVDEDFVTIPKKHFKFGITADFYVAIKLDKSMEKAQILGYIDVNSVNKKSKNDSYYLINLDELSSCSELIEKIKTNNEIFIADDKHQLFEEFYLSYIDNEIEAKAKKQFIKHLTNCQKCRENFVEFYDFESIVKNSNKHKEIFEDHTLDFFSGKVLENERYLGKEALIDISSDADILDGLFPHTVCPLLVVNETVVDDLLDIPTIVGEAEIVLNSSNDLHADLTADVDIPEFLDIETLSDDLETVGLNAVEEDDLVLAEGADLSLEEDEKFVALDSIDSEGDKVSELADIEDLTSFEPLTEDLDKYNTELFDEKAENTSIGEDFIDDNDLDELNYEEMPLEDAVFETVENQDNNLIEDEDDFLSELSSGEQDNELLKEDFVFDNSLEQEEETKIVEEIEEDSFMLTSAEDQYREAANNFSDVFNMNSADDTESTAIIEEFEAVTRANVLDSDEDADIFDSQGLGKAKPVDDFNEFINSGKEMNISHESFLSMGNAGNTSQEEIEDDNNNGLKLLFNNSPSNGDHEQVQSREREIEIDSEPQGDAKDKKMIILASCVVGCVLLATILGVTIFVNKNKEKAELVNQQILNQSQNAVNVNQYPTENSTGAPTEQNLLKDSSASVPKDMNKVMTNVFSETPSSVTVTKIAWEVPQRLATNPVFARYLQITGKNLQLNLKTDLVNATEFAYNDKVKVEFIVTKDNKINEMKVLSSSGSEQIDQIVLQSIKETLQYINVPQIGSVSPNSTGTSPQGANSNNASQDNFYDLKLVINF